MENFSFGNAILGLILVAGFLYAVKKHKEYKKEKRESKK